MSDADEYKFKIDAYSPGTIPMQRLVEYIGGAWKAMRVSWARAGWAWTLVLILRSVAIGWA
jgi:hypothetical protein